MNHISARRAAEILQAAAGKHIAVLGDFMLDRHLKGSVRRISPEAPVPVVEIETETTGLGGAGNVVQNLAGLGVVPVVFGVVGDDAAGQVLRGHLEHIKARAGGIVVSNSRRTTEKMRIIAQDQHVVRADRESARDIARDEEERMLEELDAALSNLHGLILQDYNKGVLTARVIEESLKRAAGKGVPVSARAYV
jgi:rfaE bifunctional protein kinase chain/domain